MQKHSKPAGIFPRGGFWHIDKVVQAGNGKKRRLREPTGCREEEIKQASDILTRRIEETRHELLFGREYTFREAAVEYVLHLERKGKDPSRAEQDLELLDPYIGDLVLSHVHQGALVAFESDQVGVRRSSTIERAYRTATAVLNLAARVLRDDNRPWLATAVPKITAPDWHDKLLPYQVNWAEQDNLVDELADHLVPAALFDVYTGAREQEVAGLRWDQERHVDGMPRGSVWWVPPEIRKGNAKKTASKQKGRYLVCNAMARSVIDGQRDNDSDFVFPGPSGERVGRINNSGWRGAWRRAGLPGREEGYKRGIHNLRHTFGERLEAAGVPEFYKKALLGHEINDVTAIYSPPGLARMLENAELVTRESAIVLKVVQESTTHNHPTSKKESAPESAKSLKNGSYGWT